MKTLCIVACLGYGAFSGARKVLKVMNHADGDVLEMTLLVGLVFLVIFELSKKSKSSSSTSPVATSAMQGSSNDHKSKNLSLREKKAAVIRGWLNSWVAGGSFPNGIVSIREKGQDVFFHASGYANAEKKQLVDRDTIFRIYSMTKPITTIAILILQERGLLKTTDTLDKYCPEFATMQVYSEGATEEDLRTVQAARKITIHDLLTHTSGISYAFLTDHLVGRILAKKVPNNDAANFFVNTPVDVLTRCIAESPLCYQPGSKWLYGLNTDLLGYIVELVSGSKLDQFFETEIFAPLGMKKTGFAVSPQDLHKLSECYEVAPGHCIKLSVSPERDRSVLKALLAGGGGLVSTVDDYQTFATMLAREGQYVDKNGIVRNLVKAASIRAMRQNHLPDGVDLASFGFDKSFSETVGAGYGFGYGVSTVIKPSEVPGGSLSPIGEYGWGGIASTSFFVDPVNEITCVFMTQLIPSRAYPVRPQLKWLSHWLCRDDLDDSSDAMYK
jgi:CubicO group peptidase (beta-lactamase class C family)